MKYFFYALIIAGIFAGCSSSVDTINLPAEERLAYAVKIYEDEDYEEEDFDPNEKDEKTEDMLDNDELSPEEEGFMKGEQDAYEE